MTDFLDSEQQNQAAMDEQRILKEIEESFCVAGYDVIESTVEQIGRRKEA